MVYLQIYVSVDDVSVHDLFVHDLSVHDLFVDDLFDVRNNDNQQRKTQRTCTKDRLDENLERLRAVRFEGTALSRRRYADPKKRRLFPTNPRVHFFFGIVVFSPPPHGSQTISDSS